MKYRRKKKGVSICEKSLYRHRTPLGWHEKLSYGKQSFCNNLNIIKKNPNSSIFTTKNGVSMVKNYPVYIKLGTSTNIKKKYECQHCTHYTFQRRFHRFSTNTYVGAVHVLLTCIYLIL